MLLQLGKKLLRLKIHHQRRLVLYTGVSPLMSETHAAEVKIFHLSIGRDGVIFNVLEMYKM